MTAARDTNANGKTEVIHLTMAPVNLGAVTAFAALRMTGDTVRVFFNQAARADAFGPTAEHGDPSTGVLRVVPIRGKAGLYVDVSATPGTARIDLRYDDATMRIPVAEMTPHDLAGNDCLLSTLNQALGVPAPDDDLTDNPMANPRYIRDWLTHHVTTQGVTAALLVNRLGPDGAGIDFAARLGRHLSKKSLPQLKCVIVIDVPTPTGRIGAGDERHLLFAPDAPGKSRMTPPRPDPWRAPFGDEVLLEYLRHAFFSRSQGVAYLDLSDWLTQPDADQGTVFDLARAATPDPLLPLIGRRAYPWKLSNNGKASVGDHICTPFDLDGRFGRWVVCPALTHTQGAVWRPHRIIGLKGANPKDHALWRFSALRHPGAAPAQLAPKSSLQENDALLAVSQDVFGHDPFRMPQAEPQPKTAQYAADHGDKIVLVTAMKNEGPFLLEWIAYHRAIGVSDIIVFTNDCTDGTDTLLDTLADRGIVQHYPNPYREMNLRPQHAGFRAAEALPAVKNADWLMTLDVDEFINIHVGDGHLRDLFAHVGDANMISCTWRLFGNGGKTGFTDDFVTRQFTQCALKSAGRPHQAWGFKTLYQNNGHFKKLGVHRPKGLRGQMVDQVRWVNGSGQAMPEREYRTGWRSNAQTIGYDLVSLNHYAVRSVESFLVKRDRGRVNHVDRDQGAAYWFRMNHNSTSDTSIQRMMPALKAEFGRLMADPEIKKGHAHCVAQHQAKIAQLLQQAEQRDFHDLLKGGRFQALSRMLSIFGANVFLAGPDSVPQDLVDQFEAGALSDDFYFSVPRPEETEH